MISRIRYIAYILFIFSIAMWLGSGVYHTIQTTATWYKDPHAYVGQLINHPLPGEINPFPVLAVFTAFTAILALILHIKYKGSGKFEVLVSVYGTILIILITAVYFVPALEKILSYPPVYSASELSAKSHEWIILNFIRILVTISVFISGLAGLSKFRTGSSS